MPAEQIASDLAYVRSVVEHRQGTDRLPLGVALVWAFYAWIGFTGLDLNPERASWFLMLACPVCFALSWYIGARAGWKTGEWDRTRGWRKLQHWGIMLIAFGAILLMAFAGRLQGNAMGQVIMLIVGMGYFLAGLHFSTRLFRLLGLIMIVGGVAITYIDRWGWTTLGVVLGIGLLASSLAGRPRHEPAEQTA